MPDDLLAHPGWAILGSLQALAGVMRILHANTHELITWLDRTDDPAVLLTVWNASEPKQLDDYLDETERLLFNSLASAHARVDFYRAVNNRGQIDGPLRTDYQRRVELFRDNPLHNWFMGSRNFMLHHRLPILRGNLEIRGLNSDSTSMKSSVLIDATPMLVSSAFNSVAKAWMSADKTIVLRESVVSYLQLLDSFDGWFGPAFTAHHLEACESFLAARERLAVRTRAPGH